MAQQNDEWKWMIGQLSGNTSREEEELLTAWINKSRQNKVLFDEVKKIWALSNTKLHLDAPSTGEEWEKLEKRIQRQGTQKNIFLLPQVWMSIAACLVLVLGSIYYFNPNKPPEKIITEKVITPDNSPAVQKIEEASIITTSGATVVTLKLPDNSRVWLNTNSTLTYSKDFIKDRKLELVGEAYFIVTHDKKHPFQVSTKFANVVVLGTSFNVKEKDSLVIVSVATGKVKITSEKELTEIVLKANEKGVYKKGKLSKSIIDNPSFGAWREKNNAVYEDEKKRPTHYLSNDYSWKKNQINRSVIEGKLTNSASLATFHHIILKATYIKRNKKTVTVRINIEQTIQPGQTISYHKKLLDILTQTQSFKVEIEKVEVSPNHYF